MNQLAPIQFQTVMQFAVFDANGLYLGRSWGTSALAACRDWNSEHAGESQALSAVATDEPLLQMESITLPEFHARA